MHHIAREQYWLKASSSAGNWISFSTQIGPGAHSQNQAKSGMGQSRPSTAFVPTHLATWDTISLILCTYTVRVQEYVVHTFIYSFHFKHLPDAVVQSDYNEL